MPVIPKTVIKKMGASEMGFELTPAIMERAITLTLFVFLAITAIGIVRLRNLFAVVMLSGVYSLLSAGLFVVLDAVDVAFTEAAVGAGISTVLMLGTLALTSSREKMPEHSSLLPLFVCIIVGAVLIYGTLDMPHFGAPDAPIHQYLMPDFIEGTEKDIVMPNSVTAILADYRGFDTMGETGVIFTAGVGVILLLTNRRRRKKQAGSQTQAKES